MTKSTTPTPIEVTPELLEGRVLALTIGFASGEIEGVKFEINQSGHNLLLAFDDELYSEQISLTPLIEAWVEQAVKRFLERRS